MNNKNIAWCIWQEDLLSDILQSQVLPVVKKLAKLKGRKIYIFWFSHTWAPSTSPKDFSKLKKSLEIEKVIVIRIPIIFIPRRYNSFFMHWFASISLLPFTLTTLSILVLKNRIGVLHVRSYPAVPSCILLKTIFTNLRIIFDTRSPFPEESVLSGRWAAESTTYRYWKWVERKAISILDLVLVVSVAHKGLLQSLNSDAENIKVLRNNADSLDVVANNSKNSSQNIVNSNTLSRLNFVYVGSLSKGGWNDPDIYVEVAKYLNSIKREFHILFITRDAAAISDAMNAASISGDRFAIYSCPAAEVISSIPPECIGLNLMLKRDVRMSVKTAEYVAAGIPYICTDMVAGASELAVEFDIGKTISAISEIAIAADYIIENLVQILDNIQKAQHELSTDTLVERLSNIYSKIES
jgi:glycosyltransferase involved in cell wall biosynthesis